MMLSQHNDTGATLKAVREMDPEMRSVLAKYIPPQGNMRTDGIRSMVPSDRAEFIALGEKALEGSKYKGMPYCRETVVYSLIRSMLEPLSGHVFVAQNNGKLTGAIVCRADSWWWACEHTGPRRAYSLFTYSQHRGDGSRLLDAFEEWAFCMPRVVMIEDDISSGRHTRATIKMYLDKGYRLTGTVLEKRHPEYDKIITELSHGRNR